MTPEQEKEVGRYILEKGGMLMFGIWVSLQRRERLTPELNGRSHQIKDGAERQQDTPPG